MKNVSMEVKYIFILLLLLSFVFLWLITPRGSNRIQTLVSQNVVSTTGIAWDTGKLVTIDPLNSREILPCKVTTESLFVSQQPPSKVKNEQLEQSTVVRQNRISADNDCSPETIPKIVSSESASFGTLQQAIKFSESPIIGKVSIAGKEKEARFIVTVTALYEGSHCATTYAAGASRRKCRNNHDYCVWLESLGGQC